MNSDGSRSFSKGEGREPPHVLPRKTGSRSIFLADYNGTLHKADETRLHPNNMQYDEPLEAALERNDIAIGYNSTALVAAALAGLNIVCKDYTNILSNPDWLDLLPYADWHHSEIKSGLAWQHLLETLP